MSPSNGQGKKGEEARYVQLSQLFKAGAYAMEEEDREKLVQALSKPVAQAKPGELGEPEPISVVEEALAVMFLFVFLGAMFWVPMGLLLFVIFVRDPVYWILLLAAWVVLSMHPIPRMEAAVHSQLNRVLFKYFSLRMVYEEKLDGQHLFIAPPHGVMPFGNLLTVHGMRNVNGVDFLGLTTDAALKLPFLRHYLASIGTVPASSHVAKKWLDKGWSIGISSGGVAEIFETNCKEGEVIMMRERKGFIKLALRTGVPVVPCYIFGNTALMSCWYDSSGILEAISRRLQAGVLPIWGRWGLPIFFRQPILGAVGKCIRVPKVEGEPSQEMIDHYHTLFVEELQKVFDRFHVLYGNGFEHKKLLIK